MASWPAICVQACTPTGFYSVQHRSNTLTKAMMKNLHPIGLLLLLSFTCFLLFAIVAPAKADIRREAEALVNWKASLASADGSLSSWVLANSTSLCHWMHVSCNADGSSMTMLNISNVSLDGTLDNFDFSAFPRLRKLILFRNGLHGTIPAGIGDLTSLVKLEITSNQNLTGTIPRSIGRLRQLTTLQLGGLGLGGALPEEIGNLTSLKKLSLQSTNLTGSIPSAIGTLKKLRVLNLKMNNLTGRIPVEIGNMTELVSINLGHNCLHGQIPDSISRLVKLGVLGLSKNHLGGHITPELGNSSIISHINIASNNFSGAFPPYICMGGALTAVLAGSNGFTSLDDLTFQNCTTLQDVDFSENNIVANLRGCFGKSSENLRQLNFGRNRMHGTLLTDGGEVFLCNSTYLELLVLSSNTLHGHLSKCLWDMRRLQFLDLSHNSFSGIVPFSKTRKLALQSLHLANNNFRGVFPSVLKKGKKLITLDMGGNNFSGGIPSWISKRLPKLRFLLLSSNMFDGIIPPQILQFSQLQVLDLSKNKLTGPIPNDFTNFTGMMQEQFGNLTYRFLQAEKLQLVLKNGVYVYTSSIASMAGIDLSCNLLSQEIPKGLTTLRGVRYLNLSRNHLSGDIPRDIGNLLLLESLDLSQNQLSGEIPISIADLTTMGTLNLSSNGLSGRIPTGPQLQTFDSSTYSNNSGLCGFPLQDCINSSISKPNEMDQDEDSETLLLYCFVVAGVIFGFCLYWSMLLFCNETWICVFYQHIDNIQDKVITKIAAYCTSSLECDFLFR